MTQNITLTDSQGRSVDWWVQEQVAAGRWREETIPADVVGLARPMTVFRARRKTNLIMFDWHGDEQTFCPPMWSDLAIGSGACGLGCRTCVDGSTWIYTDLGPLRVSDLYTRIDERSWRVLGYDSHFRTQWTPLVAMAIKPTPSDHLSFQLDTGHTVQVTADHPMIVARPGHFEGWDGTFEAHRIKLDDWLPITQTAPALPETMKFLDLVDLPWTSAVRVEDHTLAARLPRSTSEIAKMVGQQPLPDRKYPLTKHAFRGLYELQEYRDVLRVTGITPDDGVVIRAAYGHTSLPRLIPLDYHLGFVFGHYLAEGSLTDRELNLAVHQREAAYAEAAWRRPFTPNVMIAPKEGLGATLRIAHTTIAKLFALLVPGDAFTKRVPAMTWQAPKAFVQGLLAGLFFGDGHLDQNGALIYATCSEGLAADTRLLLWHLGYSPTIVRNNYRTDKIAFQVRVQMQQATSLIRELELPWTVRDRDRSMSTHRYPYALLMERRGSIWGTTGATRWKQRYEAQDITLSSWGQQVVDGGLGLARVKAINTVASTEPIVYDLQTGTGNFVAGDGILVHNCFLMLTHRVRRDPSRHLLYDNLDDFRRAAERWLIDPQRRPQHTLGVGIDRSDSLLYERVAPHVHNLAPLFGDSRFNPRGNPLILLTKTANTPALDDIDPSHRHAIKVTFSLNPEAIADLWEGKREDGTRITPQVARRLEAARHAQNLGFEVRARIDPILTPEGWEEHYRAFFAEIKRLGIHFTYYTLGTFRQKNDQLAVWAAYWGLRPMEWQPEPGEMVKHGTHEHLPAERRLAIYTAVRDMIRAELPGARVSLCKETNDVRKAAGLCNADCNCLVSPRARPAGERIPLVDMGA